MFPTETGKPYKFTICSSTTCDPTKNETGELSYNATSSGCNHQTAAGVFARMLQLNDWGFVALEQDAAYVDIKVAPGPRFEEHLMVEEDNESVVLSYIVSDESIVASSSLVAT